jgi:hypothetical protein
LSCADHHHLLLLPPHVKPACPSAAVFVTASVVNSLLRKWRESFDERLRQLRVVQERMAAATSYAEWREFAQQVGQGVQKLLPC